VFITYSVSNKLCINLGGRCFILQDDTILQKCTLANEVGRACGTRGRVERSVQSFGRKAQRKETTRKTKVYMGG
jgi:hypothetical protein